MHKGGSHRIQIRWRLQIGSRRQAAGDWTVWVCLDDLFHDFTIHQALQGAGGVYSGWNAESGERESNRRETAATTMSSHISRRPVAKSIWETGNQSRTKRAGREHTRFCINEPYSLLRTFFFFFFCLALAGVRGDVSLGWVNCIAVIVLFL